MKFYPILTTISASMLIRAALAQTDGPGTSYALPADPLGSPTTLATTTPNGRTAGGEPFAIGLSLYWENDGNFAKPNNSTDRDYSAGTGTAIQWQSPQTTALVGQIPSINNEFSDCAPDTSFSMGVVLSLNIYTPKNITDPNPIYDQHPYAGWTSAGVIFQRANRNAKLPTFEHIEWDIGTIGPSGQSGMAQRTVHRTFGYTDPQGWDNQIRDEIGADFKYLRRWRVDLAGPVNSPWLQVLPEAGFVLGTMHLNASAGATLRAGWNMPDDFGPGRMRYANDFTRPFGRTNPIENVGAYAFIRTSGHVVAHDSTIQGSYFRSSPVVLDQEVFTAEIQAGAAIEFLKHIELAYSQTYTSPEFIGQNGWDSYGAISLTMVYTW